MSLLLLFLVLFADPATSASTSYHPVEACVDDDRGYTLCVAETDFERAQSELNQQWTVALSHVEASQGARVARRLRSEQRKWIRHRERHCEVESAGSPVTQRGRNYMSCMDLLTQRRTAQLRAIAQSK